MIYYDFQMMLEARHASQYSSCTKRKIGVTIPVGEDSIWGYNNTVQACTSCSRETCGAIHAEVQALTELIRLKAQHSTHKMYMWAEVSCLQCLNFIKKNSAIDLIFCLSPESYLTEYPIIARRTEEIKQRREYARSLGITIIELDREEILEYELSQHPKTHVQPDQA